MKNLRHLSSQEKRVLRALTDYEGTPFRTICKKANITPGAGTKTIQYLMRVGWIEEIWTQSPNGEGKAASYMLTESAAKLLSKETRGADKIPREVLEKKEIDQVESEDLKPHELTALELVSVAVIKENKVNPKCKIEKVIDVKKKKPYKRTPAECDKCGESFPSKQARLAHRRACKGEKSKLPKGRKRATTKARAACKYCGEERTP